MVRRATDPLDGAPFVAGCVTLLRQFHSDNTEHCLSLIGQYVRSMVESTAAARCVCVCCSVLTFVKMYSLSPSLPLFLSPSLPPPPQ